MDRYTVKSSPKFSGTIFQCYNIEKRRNHVYKCFCPKMMHCQSNRSKVLRRVLKVSLIQFRTFMMKVLSRQAHIILIKNG